MHCSDLWGKEASQNQIWRQQHFHGAVRAEEGGRPDDGADLSLCWKRQSDADRCDDSETDEVDEQKHKN